MRHASKVNNNCKTQCCQGYGEKGTFTDFYLYCVSVPFFGREQFGKIAVKIPQGSNPKGKTNLQKGSPSGTVPIDERF